MERMNTFVRSLSDILTGANYDRTAELLGFGRSFYRTAADLIPTNPYSRILELGCGTASLTLAIADKHGGKGWFHGMDLRPWKLSFAQLKAREARVSFEPYRRSMRTLPFESASMDMVVAGPSFHQASPALRRRALNETGRVLKPKGVFALIDWSKPRFGLMALILFPLLMFKTSGDHWNNTYPMLCRDENLLLIMDTYVNSVIRCQVFRKA
ncbi:MAG: class I SAM-dependent methyltransferase [Deltaproteobacteria bacterium]|nr:class I SAM-dependent methyltransferase [Deltaproteobacteria bacterium]